MPSLPKETIIYLQKRDVFLGVDVLPLVAVTVEKGRFKRVTRSENQHEDGKITVFKGKYIFKRLVFHCHLYLMLSPKHSEWHLPSIAWGNVYASSWKVDLYNQHYVTAHAKWSNPHVSVYGLAAWPLF